MCPFISTGVPEASLLRFRLEQMHLGSLEKWFLPLPKMGARSLSVLSEHLEAGGFTVHLGRGAEKLVVTKGSLRISVDGHLGLASSNGDMLDSLGPAIPKLMEAGKRSSASESMDVSTLYLSYRRSKGSTLLRILPRLESLRTWTCLRSEGLSGLTVDEAAALKRALVRADRASTLSCVTATPRDGSSPFQVGGRMHFRSVLRVSEFLSSLSTIGQVGSGSAFLPRDSVVEVRGPLVQGRVTAGELGEWCLIQPETIGDRNL